MRRGDHHTIFLTWSSFLLCGSLFVLGHSLTAAILWTVPKERLKIPFKNWQHSKQRCQSTLEYHTENSQKLYTAWKEKNVKLCPECQAIGVHLKETADLSLSSRMCRAAPSAFPRHQGEPAHRECFQTTLTGAGWEQEWQNRTRRSLGLSQQQQRRGSHLQLQGWGVSVPCQEKEKKQVI